MRIKPKPQKPVEAETTLTLHTGRKGATHGGKAADGAALATVHVQLGHGPGESRTYRLDAHLSPDELAALESVRQKLDALALADLGLEVVR